MPPKLLLLIVLAFTLSACSYRAEFYIVNHTGHPIQLTLSTFRPVASLVQSGALVMRVGSISPDKIKKATHKTLTNQLAYQTINSSKISFELPPTSTLLVGRALNEFYEADSLTVSSENQYLALNRDQLWQQLVTNGYTIVRYSFHVR